MLLAISPNRASYLCNETGAFFIRTKSIHPINTIDMEKKLFLQALVEVKSELLICRVKLSLPVVKNKEYSTPYLRRRIHLHGPHE